MTKTLITTAFLTTLVTVAHAQGNDASNNCASPCTIAPSAPAQTPQLQPEPGYAGPQPAVQAAPQPAQPAADDEDDDTGWHRPAGRRFFHGFRIGAMYLANYDQVDTRRTDSTHMDGMSIKDQLKLTSPYMMLIGYEGFYRIVGHSWLNVIMVGNVSVAGLDQSKFIPAASGLIGFEFQKSFQLGVGVNVLPDAVAPSHAIIAAGWTPRVGSIQTPVHFFIVPDHGDSSGNAKNWRTGATVGMNW
jgi:hypothetical protein